MTQILETERLNVVFRLSSQVTVNPVSDVSLQVNQGETVGIVGESGSGKSVLVRTMMGLTNEVESARITGTVHYKGLDLISVPQTRRRKFWGQSIGLVLQDPMNSLNPVRRAGTQLLEVINRWNPDLSGGDATRKADELLMSVGIPDPKRIRGMYPHQLSGGLCQRVAIAAALASDIDLLIADEPTTALDVSVQNQILHLLVDKCHTGDRAMVLVSHDLAVVAGRTDRVVVMYAGQVVEDANTQDVFSNPKSPYTWSLLNSIPRMTGHPGAPLTPIKGRPPNLSRITSGCRFASRCPKMQSKCLNEEPPLTADENGHRYRCWFPLNFAGVEK